VCDLVSHTAHRVHARFFYFCDLKLHIACTEKKDHFRLYYEHDHAMPCYFIHYTISVMGISCENQRVCVSVCVCVCVCVSERIFFYRKRKIIFVSTTSVTVR